MKKITLHQVIENLWMKNSECALRIYGIIKPLNPTTNIVIAIYFDNDKREHCQVYVDVKNSEEDLEAQEDNKYFTEYVYTKAGLFVAEWKNFHMNWVMWTIKDIEAISHDVGGGIMSFYRYYDFE